MSIFKRLLGAQSGSGNKRRGKGEDRGIYLYVRLDKSGEIVKIRLDPFHDLAPDYENENYFSRKAIIGPKSIERADAVFYFDNSRSLERADISGGSLSDEEEYNTQGIDDTQDSNDPSTQK